MKLNSISFLTSNPQKAKYFSTFGIGVQEFNKEIIEISSNDVELVALHKARDTNLNNIVVEDTSLNVSGSPYPGTDIKHVYQIIENDESYNGNSTVWEVSLCIKKDDNFYIATGRTQGILKYPALDFGYHFNRIFAPFIDGKEPIQFELLSQEEKDLYSPRFKALRILSNALLNNDYSQLKIISEHDVSDWDGEYQKETIQKKKKQI